MPSIIQKEMTVLPVVMVLAVQVVPPAPQDPREVLEQLDLRDPLAALEQLVKLEIPEPREIGVI